MFARVVSGVAFLFLATAPCVAAQPGGKSKSRPPIQDAFLKLSPEGLLEYVEAAGGAAFAEAKRGNLTVTIIERGAVEAVDCSDVTVRRFTDDRRSPGPRQFTTIKWIIDDGAMVRKGDRLVVLDDAPLQKQAVPIRASLNQAKAAFAQAQANLALMQSETTTETRLGEIDVRLAQLEVKKAPVEDREVFELKVEKAKLLLERTRAQGRAKVLQAESEVHLRRQAVDQEETRLAEILKQIDACVLTAPQEGYAVYHVSPASRFGGPTAIVAQGEPVVEGQKLIRVCDLKRLQLATRVHEAQISRVKPGQPANVRVDAYPNKPLEGKVDQVATVASQAEWLQSDVKVYAVNIGLPEAGPRLKPGMTAEARIDAGGKNDALHVPASAVIRLGGDLAVFVKEGKKLERRIVTVGLSADQGVEIRSGLEEGVQVLRDPQAVLRRLGPGN
jgi:RND family efflux transporter MFP subunit